MNTIMGIDIAKRKFDIALSINNKIKHKVCENNELGFVALHNFLKSKKINKVHACLEATGTYGENLANYLYQQGHTVSIVNPARIKGFAQSNLSRNKTDKSDAVTILHFCDALKPDHWKPMQESIKILQALVKRYEQLINMKQQEKNRLSSLLATDKFVAKYIEKNIGHLEKQMQEIANEINKHINCHSELKKKKELLQSIKGIGETTIHKILAFIGQPELFDGPKKMVAYLGLNPKRCQSGSSINRKATISKIGNAEMRKALYMPAIVAKRHNPIIKRFCDNLAAKGKSKMVIICAAMRKLVHIIYGVLKTSKPFNPEMC